MIVSERPLPHANRRRVVHFAGFEPLDGIAHHARYKRSMGQSAATYGFRADVGPILDGNNQPEFIVESYGPNWASCVNVTILDHSDIIQEKLSQPLWRRLIAGFAAAFLVIFYGAFFNYVKVAWRFATFFLFPFLLIMLGICFALTIAFLPLQLGLSTGWIFLSAAVAAYFFRSIFLPFSNRFHTLLLMSDWVVAVDLVARRNKNLNSKIEQFSAALANALRQPADEYLISSHSMGGAMLIEAMGAVLIANPTALNTKKVVVCTIGGAGLQCTLFRNAKALRAKAQLIVDNPHVTWLDVQCLTDVANFYKAPFRAVHNLNSVNDTKVILVRAKNMLSAETYNRIKRDFLRVHRQFLLGSERRSNFDFSLMTVAPFSASTFAEFSNENLPPIAQDGSLII